MFGRSSAAAAAGPAADAADRGRIGAAEVALLGHDLPADGLRRMQLAHETLVARDLLRRDRQRHRGKARAAGAAGPDGKAARALRQRAEPRAAARSLTSIWPTRPSASG